MDTDLNFAVVIMAAGKGTRLKSRRPKVLHEIGGKPLLMHVIAAAESISPPSSIFCIVGHQADSVRTVASPTGVQFVTQLEQRGTGHAIQVLKQHFKHTRSALPENLLILSGDVPLIRPETLQDLCRFHTEHHAAMTILTAMPDAPQGYGRVLRKSGNEVLAIVEQKDLTAEQQATNEINSGIYCFNTKALFERLDKLSDENANKELYLTDIAKLLAADGMLVVATVARDIDEVLGANTIAEMMHLDAAMRLSTARRLMAAGVTIFRPDTCVIDAGVQVGADTTIEPFVQLLGNTTVGQECRIRSYSVIQNSVLADGVLIRNGCVLDTATVARGAMIGPYSHLRPKSEIGEDAHVGNFTETKNVRLGKGSKANHLSYLGDAEIGTGVNVGAGAITCNYDGVHKHITTIGDRVFVGSDSTLVAPVHIGEGSYIAAGSCITEDVPAGSLAIGRSRQTTKPGWADRKKKQKPATTQAPL
jgi:bifunctional UDP-N-acetylglucosamine pyrophosphorylase/glucosamine-1-phosphate N-acetyltransferase